MRARVALVVVILAQAMLAGWALGVPGRLMDADDPGFTPAEIAPSNGPIDIELGAPIAFQHAARWSSDARLVSAVMRLDWPTEAATADQIALPESGWLVYTFASGDHTLSVYLDRRTGVYITNTQTDNGDDLLPAIDLAAFTRGSTTAALTAEVLHGAAYRASCPGTRRTALVTPSRTVDASGVATPIWVVTYADSRFTGDFDVLVTLDASKGNVIESESVEGACGD